MSLLFASPVGPGEFELEGLHIQRNRSQQKVGGTETRESDENLGTLDPVYSLQRIYRILEKSLLWRN